MPLIEWTGNEEKIIHMMQVLEDRLSEEKKKRAELDNRVSRLENIENSRIRSVSSLEEKLIDHGVIADERP